MTNRRTTKPARKQDPKQARKPDPKQARKPGPNPGRKPDPKPARKPEPTPGLKPDPALEANSLVCTTPADWESWLERHHADSGGVWLKIAKKGSGIETVRYPEVLTTAIAWGWIDARRQAHDDTYFLQRFTPRGPRSKWSQRNRATATELIDRGLMREPGLQQVRAAQADGRWDAAYEAQSQATIPEDFQQALDANPAAKEFFATLTGSRRYAFLYRLHHVRTPARRAQRIAKYIVLLSDGQTLN